MNKNTPPLTLSAWMRYDFILRALNKIPAINSVLEIGTGEGSMGARLAQKFSYTGIELDPISFKTAKYRLEKVGSGKMILGDISKLNPKNKYDLICAFEVLEHIENDLVALKNWKKLINNNGWILISVPAFEKRYNAADRNVGHFRRYQPDKIKILLEKSGFKNPQVWTYGFPFGYITEPIRNYIASQNTKIEKTESRTLASGRWLQPSEKFGWLTEVISIPFRIIQSSSFAKGKGTGLVVLAQNND